MPEATAPLGISERSVEVPWALERLGAAERILDAGCAASAYLEALAAQPQRRLYGIDPDGPKAVAGAVVVRGTVMAPPFRQKAFDLILCVSTVEHIGLPIYDQPEFAHGDMMAMRHMRRLLRPGGRMLLTVPFGRRQRNPWLRVYDAPRLRLLTTGWRRLSEAYFRLVRDGEGFYESCPPRTLREAGYDFAHMRSEGVACLELTPAGGPAFVLARAVARATFAVESITGKERSFLRRDP